MALTPAESAAAQRLRGRSSADYANDGHRTNFVPTVNDTGAVAQGVGRVSGEVTAAIELLEANYPNATDMASAKSEMPAYNIFPDSGRLCQPSSTIYAGTFLSPRFFIPFNGASAWTSAGKFEHSGASQPEPVASLIAHTSPRNTGPEFYVGEITAGTGTVGAITVGADTYSLITFNDNFWMPYTSTLGFFVRVISGGVYVGSPHEQDGITTPAGTLPVGSWRYVRVERKTSQGIDSGFPGLRATPGSVLQMALPSLIPGSFAHVPIDHALPVLTTGVYA